MKHATRILRIALLLVLVCVLAGAALFYRLCYVQPLLSGQQAATIEVAAGKSLRAVAHDLGAQGVLPHPLSLVLLAHLRGESNAMRAGEYRIQPGTTVAGLLAQFVSGRVVLHSLTLVDGWNFSQVFEAIEHDPYLVHTLHGLTPLEVMNRLGHPKQNPEGMFYPDTYSFSRATTDAAFLQRAYRMMQTHLNAAWAARAPDLPYKTSYDALIMASVIEKETGQAAERAQIAGVFVRRLQKNMKLQSDPTVIYGLGNAYTGDITSRNLRTDTPYNTYTRHGLPPTPICMPPLAAIQAALHPAPGDALYFVARGDGTHQFSATLAEQNAAVQKYQLTHRGRRNK
ncbi:MAG TPA: endolytic transglycosylase MltG [Gammaproteobacteria bacterium]|nr:endolytic transglycosylase MltG [Gammaproteobacteria bacterium]